MFVPSTTRPRALFLPERSLRGFEDRTLEEGWIPDLLFQVH